MSCLATCSEPWQRARGSEGVVCPGTLMPVEASDFQTWPPITYAQANQVIAAALLVLGLAYVVRRVLKLPP